MKAAACVYSYNVTFLLNVSVVFWWLFFWRCVELFKTRKIKQRNNLAGVKQSAHYGVFKTLGVQSVILLEL